MKKPAFFLICVFTISMFASRFAESQELDNDSDYVNSLDHQSKMIDSLLSIPDTEISNDPGTDPCSPQRRQILMVETFAVNFATYQDTAGKPVKVNKSIILLGRPSPSSCRVLFRAYIHFVPDGTKLRFPIFNPPTEDNPYAQMRLFYPESYFEEMLFDLRNAKDIYCWRHEFSSEYIYGQVETNRTLPLKP